MTGLALAADTRTLGWSPPSTLGGTSVVYDVLRSPSPSDFTAATVCVESNDGSDAAAMDQTVPAMGQALYYLVRAENACPGTSGTGPLGIASDGTPRTGRTCP